MQAIRLFFLLNTLSFFFISAIPVAAGKISSQLQAVLESADPSKEIAVIVELKSQVNRNQFRNLNKNLRRQMMISELRRRAEENEPAIRSLMEQRGGKKIRQLWMINSFAVQATPAAITAFSRQPGVAEVRLDNPVLLAIETGAATSSTGWNISMVEADQLWAQGYNGQGVVVASMDSGVDYLHSELNGNWRGGTNSWYDPHGEHPTTPYDANGHGTNTMGIMVGQNLGTTFGMAPQAQWIAVKIFSDAGNALYSDIHAGFQWLIDPDGDPLTDDAPDIVNNSWGFPETINSCMTEFQTDILTLRDLDISVVFSAGNQGGATSSISPANNEGVFSVGAVDQNQIISAYSNQGPSACGQGGIYPTAVAPGIQVTTASLTFGGSFPSATLQVSGTSFAAPHISGAMALLLSSNLALTPPELEAAITQTAADLGDPGADYVYGHGLLNLADALIYASSSGQCTDADLDGFYLQPYCGTEIDCDDTNARIYPGAPELIFDGIDQNCNGQDLKTLAPILQLLRTP